MYRRSLVPRYLLTLLLILAVSVVGVFPALVGFVDAAEPGVVLEPGGKTCCCGQQGECCGMGCCGASAPKPDPSPAPANSQQEPSGPVPLTFMQAILLLHGRNGGSEDGFDISRHLGRGGTASLQAQQIRLQV